MKPSMVTGMILLALVVSGAQSLFAQMPEPEVRKRLDWIYNGQAERVRAELPTLEQEYPNDGGVRYLDAILTTDGAQAEKKFQTIVDQMPKSDWADDALYRVYQYYYSVGLYVTADKKFQELKQDYPNSVYVAGVGAKAQPETTASTKTPVSLKEPSALPTDTAAVAPPARVSADTSVSTSAGGRFAVQTGAFSTAENAQREISRLVSYGYRGEISTKDSGGKTLYIVFIGGFQTEKEARDLIQELKTKHNIDSIFLQR